MKYFATALLCVACKASCLQESPATAGPSNDAELFSNIQEIEELGP